MISTRSSRKRRRPSLESIAPVRDLQEQDTLHANAVRAGRTLNIWEAFREEYSESVEQLPLSLYRSFTLLNELDAQAHAHESGLLPTIREYIRKRHATMGQYSLASDSNAKPEAHSSGHISPNCASGDRKMNESYPIHGRVALGEEKRLLTLPVNCLLDLSTLSNDLLRASEEKVNLAQATYDSVDRHVRLLDQAIKEHESHITSDRSFRSGLPSVESSTRSVRTPSLRGATRSRNAINIVQPALTLTSNIPEDLSVPGRRTRRLLVTTMEPKSISAEALDSEPDLKRRVPKPERNSIAGDMNNTAAFRPTFKAKAGHTALSSGDMPIDPHEPRYCYCNQVSWGEMIACDADDCDREWFHLGCAGLTEAPKGKSKWYCNACKERMAESGARKRGH